MTTSGPGSFTDLANEVHVAVDQLNDAVDEEEAEAINAAHFNLLGALSAATVASVEALGRFSPFTESGFFTDEAPDFTDVVGAWLDLPATW